MVILPAIDLKDGQAVRLTEGLMQTAKIYSNEPYEVAKRFQELGSEWLHVVDLNGAFKGEPENLEQIKKIRNNTDLKIELGGGVRDEDTIKMYLDLGVDRVILGSVALKDPEFVKKMAQKYKHKIALGIDAKDGYVAVQGWAQVSQKKAVDFAKEFQNTDIEVIIATDISKDGTLSGINIAFVKEIQEASGLDVIASGGVKDINDIKIAVNNEIYGIIIGKAFYEGTIDLKEAFKLVKER
ncbi:MAG: 1-(5-phosphoribosyl)-5-[(5-phosphoribosylamino)methylideneamino]imidazole-4-carboxamide isomerase [Epsilonproteobacteria bacterium]|nr:1-(5-phosphoribosyl)-5-[(5-phosphoribosylamino)methylideneamino]imidazole-4-carboxamide isomerase [Campylobacterota bacterium]